MNLETILTTILAILAGGFGTFQYLARRKVEKRYLTGLKQRTGKSKKELDNAKKQSEKAINDYKRRRATRKYDN